MNRNLVWVFLLGPVGLIAQVHGISFVQNSSWEALQARAKTENKYLFVDCYTSWSRPSKLMDKKVYSDDSVGDFMNANFVCVKLQMDTTAKDSGDIRNWYGTAHELSKKYGITAYPSYLFFSPDGRIVHKGLGWRNKEEFLELATAAITPAKQYYTLLENYRQGNKDYSVLPYMANEASKLKGDSLAILIAADYFRHYLETFPDVRLWTKDDINFILQYAGIIRFADKLFQMYHKDRKTIDSIMSQPGYTDNLINIMAYKEEVMPFVNEGIKNGLEPNWQRIKKKIVRRYGKAYAQSNINWGRVIFYRERKMWSNYAKYFLRHAENENIQNWKPGFRSSVLLNNYAFEVFKYSKDKKELETALSWADRALAMTGKPDAQTMDTKANILYKLGKKSEGLALEEQSYKLSPQDKDIKQNYEKMKSGLPSWPAE